MLAAEGNKWVWKWCLGILSMLDAAVLQTRVCLLAKDMFQLKCPAGLVLPDGSIFAFPFLRAFIYPAVKNGSCFFCFLPHFLVFFVCCLLFLDLVLEQHKRAPFSFSFCIMYLFCSTVFLVLVTRQNQKNWHTGEHGQLLIWSAVFYWGVGGVVHVGHHLLLHLLMQEGNQSEINSGGDTVRADDAWQAQGKAGGRAGRETYKCAGMGIRQLNAGRKRLHKKRHLMMWWGITASTQLWCRRQWNLNNLYNNCRWDLPEYSVVVGMRGRLQRQ